MIEGHELLIALHQGGVSLRIAPWLLLRLRGGGSGEWGVRLAGAALVATSGWALWMGLAHDTAPWCLVP